jgi:GH25 family lysozyme M1 (1,4-beta-N-acetylmuramidase)
MMQRWIDISHWQGLFDFSLVKGYDGVLLQASHGHETDPRYTANMARARRAGLRVGHYHFYEGGGADEARYFVSVVKPHFRPGDAFPAMDYETPPLQMADALAFCNVVIAAFGGVGFYSSLSFIVDAHFPAFMARCWLWLADYTAREPSPPAPWAHIALWQDTDKEKGHSLDGDLGDMRGALSSLAPPVKYRLDVIRGGRVVTRVQYGGNRVRHFMNHRLRRILKGGAVTLRRVRKGR